MLRLGDFLLRATPASAEGLLYANSIALSLSPSTARPNLYIQCAYISTARPSSLLATRPPRRSHSRALSACGDIGGLLSITPLAAGTFLRGPCAAAKPYSRPMSQEDLRDLRKAYCEDDYDEEEEVTTPIANVSIRRVGAASVTKRASYERRRRNDGSDRDSGYSSKTGTATNTSSSSSRRDMADLKIDTSSGMERREPQPYAYIQQPREKIIALPPKQQDYYVHKKGECYVCDCYGQHLPENARPRREVLAPPSPKASRQGQAPNISQDDAPRPLRRNSSVRTSSTRPLSMYTPGVPQLNYQPTGATAMMQYSPAGWTNPLTPTMPYSPAFSYGPAVMTTTYVTDHSSYFEETPLQENRPPRPDRRSSIYGDAIIRQSKVETRPKESQKATSTRDHIRSNSDRTIRAEDLMPPPPRPTEVVLTHRPGIKKSATYNTPLTATNNRRSQVLERDDAYISSTAAPSPSRDRRPEPSRPPSSYRGPADITDPRPQTRKSASYSTPTQTTKVSSSPLPPSSGPLPRRSTTTATSTETRKFVDAEAYQAQRRSLTSNELTAEALRSLKQRNPSSQSETSSHRSHHTKSSSSAGGKSKRSNSEIKMIINGVNVSIPAGGADQNISISAGKDGDVSISLGGRRDQDHDRFQKSSQKKIERASSATSRASRVSSKSIGSKDREIERERQRDSVTDLGQYERQRRQSSDASRSRSRADVTRRSHDRDRDSPNPWTD